MNPFKTYTFTRAPKYSIHKMTVSTTCPIEAGDVFIDAEAEYCAETGEILFLTMNGKPVSWENVTAALELLGVADKVKGWDDDLDSWKLSELIADQHATEACDNAREKEE